MTIPKFALGVLFLCWFLKAYFSLAADIISPSQSLSGYTKVVSKGGASQMGFFNPSGDANYYLGIWLLNDASRKIVWVANREKPNSFYSELRISDGNLVLFDESNIAIWSTNVSNSRTAFRSVQAVLLDTGNLILNDIESNSSEPLWKSFDQPTDTFLAGMKIGYNKITKRSQVLTSWKNSEDPAPGLYTLELDPNDNSFKLQWNKSKTYWTSGPWNGQIFSLVPEMSHDSIFNLSFVSNLNESYLTYSVYNTSVVQSPCTLDVTGKIKRQILLRPSGFLAWSQPMQQCEVYAFCGAFGSCNESSLHFCHCLMGFEPKSQREWDLADYSGGCLRKTELHCANNSFSNGERDRFLEMPSMFLPENKQSVQADSIKDCKSSCLNNCSCTAYAFNSNTGCSIWIGDLLNLKQLATNDSNGSTLYIRLAASEFPNPSGSPGNRRFYFPLFGSIATALFTSCIAFAVIYLRRKKTVKKQGSKGNIQGGQTVGLYDCERRIIDFIRSGQFREDEKEAIDVPFVVLESILAATDKFSEANKLGEGGFGPVYKGKFPGGQEVAIKRLSSGSGQGLQEFKNEVLLIAKLQHRNLVQLLGYCVEGDEKMLLYEYMPNKSLDSFIFDQKQRLLLNWKIRFDIILGIARGLLYLHHDSRLRIIHRDLKTSNVLLDEEMNPKISDFGLAKIFGGEQTEANTNRVVGTYGYMSPEYALHGLFSIKSDVFSFGVVILEIISGKRNTGFYRSEQALSLLDYAWKLWKGNMALDLMDATLRETCNENEFLRCFNVGLLCVQDDPGDRPTMSNALFMLRSENESFPSPKQPAFVGKRSISIRDASDDKQLSKNKLTNTLNEGR